MEALSDKYKVKKVFIKRAAYFNLTFTSWHMVEGIGTVDKFLSGKINVSILLWSKYYALAAKNGPFWIHSIYYNSVLSFDIISFM